MIVHGHGDVWMHIKVAHFLSLSGLSTQCILFKCHKCIVKSSIWKKTLWTKIANLNKIFIEGYNSINIHQSYSYGLLKLAYGLCSGFYINIQMHFFVMISSIFIGTQYMIHDGEKNMDWKK
jgi:hypothetical protein